MMSSSGPHVCSDVLFLWCFLRLTVDAAVPALQQDGSVYRISSDLWCCMNDDDRSAFKCPRFISTVSYFTSAGRAVTCRDRVQLSGEVLFLHLPAACLSLSRWRCCTGVSVRTCRGWDMQIKPIFLLTHTAELTHCVWITFLLLYGLCIYVFNIKLYVFTGGTSRQSWISLTADRLTLLLSHCFFLQHRCYTSAPPRSVFGISHRLFTNSEL